MSDQALRGVYGSNTVGQRAIGKAGINQAGCSTNFGQGKDAAQQLRAVLNQHRHTVAAGDTLLFKAVGKLIGQGIKLRPVDFLAFADNGRFVWVFGRGSLKHQSQGGFFIISRGLKEN